MVLGPLPNSTDFSFNLKYLTLDGITRFSTGSWDPDENQMSFVTLGADDVRQTGIKIQSVACSDHCSVLTCGQCVADPACGYCEQEAKCLPAWMKTKCPAESEFVVSGCCPVCPSLPDCQACTSTSSCAWSFDLGECISVTDSETKSARYTTVTDGEGGFAEAPMDNLNGLCKPAEHSLRGSDDNDVTCKLPPGSVIGSGSGAGAVPRLCPCPRPLRHPRPSHTPFQPHLLLLLG